MHGKFGPAGRCMYICIYAGCKVVDVLSFSVEGLMQVVVMVIGNGNWEW